MADTIGVYYNGCPDLVQFVDVGLKTLNFNCRHDYDDDRDEDEVVTWCVIEKFGKRRRNETESSREEWW